MKKITALFLPLAAAFLSAGCTQENFSQLTDHNALIFTVSIADATRTSLQVDGSSGKVSWTEGDEILINGVAYTATPDADNPGFATFTKKNSADADPQPVDGNANDAYGVTSTTLNGKQYYLDQHYGKVLDSQDGYITLNNLKFGTGSFSVAFWVKNNSVSGDPAVISNKNWASGYNSGFIIGMTSSKFQFNIGDGKTSGRTDGVDRCYVYANYPTDFSGRWMHVAVTVDRSNNEVRIYNCSLPSMR